MAKRPVMAASGEFLEGYKPLRVASGNAFEGLSESESDQVWGNIVRTLARCSFPPSEGPAWRHILSIFRGDVMGKRREDGVWNIVLTWMLVDAPESLPLSKRLLSILGQTWAQRESNFDEFMTWLRPEDSVRAAAMGYLEGARVAGMPADKANRVLADAMEEAAQVIPGLLNESLPAREHPSMSDNPLIRKACNTILEELGPELVRCASELREGNPVESARVTAFPTSRVPGPIGTSLTNTIMISGALVLLGILGTALCAFADPSGGVANHSTAGLAGIDFASLLGSLFHHPGTFAAGLIGAALVWSVVGATYIPSDPMQTRWEFPEDGATSLPPHYSIVNQREDWLEFVTIAVNALRAAVIVCGIPKEERSRLIPGILERYGLDERLGPWLTDETPFNRQREPLTFPSIHELWETLCDLYPERGWPAPRYEVIDELAAVSGIPLDLELQTTLLTASAYLEQILSGQPVLDAVYNALVATDDHRIDYATTLLLKWLGNIAEGSHSNRWRARRFLIHFVQRFLRENCDLLNAFTRFVFDKVGAVREKMAAEHRYGRVVIAVVLAGAEPLGLWLRAMAEKSREPIEFVNFLMNSSMCRRLRAIRDDFEPRGGIVHLSLDAYWDLRRHFWWNGLDSQKIGHLLFVDTGFLGTIAQHLWTILDDERISNNHVMLAYGGEPYPTGWITGLTENPAIPILRARRLATILDKALEHSLYSPAYLRENPFPTPRPWFAELVKVEIEELAAHTPSGNPEGRAESGASTTLSSGVLAPAPCEPIAPAQRKLGIAA